MENTLYKHQQELLTVNPARWLLAWEPGTGKTLTAVKLAKQKGLPTLVIMPKALKENWKREWRKWGGIDKVLFRTKEEFKKEHKHLPVAGTVIVDEAHHFVGTKSKMMKSLRWYFNTHEIPNRYFLTATPYRSSPNDIRILADLYGKPFSYKWFMDTFFTTRYFGNRQVLVPKADTEKDLAVLVNKFGNTVKMEDCLDVPDQQEREVVFSMTTDQLKALKNLPYDLPVVNLTRKHQIENGIFPSIEEGVKPHEINCDKNDYIIDLCTSTDKIAIICKYKKQLEFLREKLLKDKGITSGLISGDTKNRDEVTVIAQNSPRSVVFIQADCAEGYNLSTFNHVVYASMSWSFVSYVQSKGRFLRIDNPTKTLFTYLITAGNKEHKSVDRHVKQAVQNKKDFTTAIYDYEDESDDT